MLLAGHERPRVPTAVHTRRPYGSEARSSSIPHTSRCARPSAPSLALSAVTRNMFPYITPSGVKNPSTAAVAALSRPARYLEQSTTPPLLLSCSQSLSKQSLSPSAVSYLSERAYDHACNASW